MRRSQLQNLLIENKGIGQFRAEANADGTEATIYLYDVIVSDDYWGGVTPLAFAKELTAITAPIIHLRLNCPGGDVFASVAMAQAIREHSAKVIVHVDGYAASAATKILVEADESVISKGGMVMIHKSMTMDAGNADDFLATAGLLTKVDGQIAESYTEKTGIELEAVIAMMAAETWMTETEAIELGFVDAIAEANTDKATTNAAAWDLSAYSKPPEAKVVPDPPPVPAATPTEPNNNDDGPDIGAISVSDQQARANCLREFEIIEGAN